jgi:hypothetical protein
MIEVGTQVEWTETFSKRGLECSRLLVGTVTSLDGPHGRLVVEVPGEPLPCHIQPSFVQVSVQEEYLFQYSDEDST